MPKTIQTTVPVQNVKQGDVVVRTFSSSAAGGCRTERSTADSIKVGAKWVEVRDADGKLITRYETGMGVLVEREVPTDEEAALERLAQADLHLQWQLDKFQGGCTAAVLTKLQEKVDNVSHWDIDRLMEAAAEDRVAATIAFARERCAELYGATDNITIFTFVRSELERKARHTPNPLSRSTSTTSNIEEDLDRYMAYRLLDDAKYYAELLDARYVEMVAEATAKRDAESAIVTAN